ncbi:MAC/Perforin domain family protein [Babesia bovis T2Bo]|uniref:MAC/Perforin domain family protein n=1 Tax=Babesia bovis T2Bo TaxID=484906 RepID=UPI001C34DAA0|nr:MAC/Perforin domain family protein [Babesia bovis T2Bo]EDO06625.2 MAC/Perforin domain family protein [Babesia bovis T2Bo]
MQSWCIIPSAMSNNIVVLISVYTIYSIASICCLSHSYQTSSLLPTSINPGDRPSIPSLEYLGLGYDAIERAHNLLQSKTNPDVSHIDTSYKGPIIELRWPSEGKHPLYNNTLRWSLPTNVYGWRAPTCKIQENVSREDSDDSSSKQLTAVFDAALFKLKAKRPKFKKMFKNKADGSHEKRTGEIFKSDGNDNHTDVKNKSSKKNKEQKKQKTKTKVDNDVFNNNDTVDEGINSILPDNESYYVNEDASEESDTLDTETNGEDDELPFFIELPIGNSNKYIGLNNDIVHVSTIVDKDDRSSFLEHGVRHTDNIDDIMSAIDDSVDSLSLDDQKTEQSDEDLREGKRKQVYDSPTHVQHNVGKYSYDVLNTLGDSAKYQDQGEPAVTNENDDEQVQLSEEEKTELSKTKAALSFNLSIQNTQDVYSSNMETVKNETCTSFVAGTTLDKNSHFSRSFENALKHLLRELDKDIECSLKDYGTAACKTTLTRWFHFFRNYGTHVITRITLGGKIIIEKKQLDEGSRTSQSASGDLKAHIVSPDFQLNAGLDKNNESKSSQNVTSTTMDMFGGEIGPDYETQEFNPLWAKSVSYSPMPISMELTPLAKLFESSGYRDHYYEALLHYAISGVNHR